MCSQEPRPVMAHAFRETALTLLGLYRIYDVDPELADATAHALGRLFRRHLRHDCEVVEDDRTCALHALVDELDRVAAARL